MARERLISSEDRPGDQPVDATLRPQWLAEMVGQRAVLEKLGIAMAVVAVEAMAPPRDLARAHD